MCKLVIKLKQHTPLIHFQHDQAGATLRATEVKPKLDRFILTKLGDKDGIDEGWRIAKRKGWLIDDSEKDSRKYALNYKMRFIIDEKPKISIINEIAKDRQGNIKIKNRKSDGRTIKELKPYPLFFANLDKDIEDPTEYKCFSMLKKPFVMELFSFHTELLEFIKDEDKKGDFKIYLLAEFFQFNNFGTRQSKGFGSFYLDESDTQYDEFILKYRFGVDINNVIKKWFDLFDTIDLFYKSLRSGINICWDNKFYMKPAIFKYAKDEKKEDWEKKNIKQIFFFNQKPNHAYLFKDLLGLSTEESWQSHKAMISKSSADIDRFQSPILFKPIMNDGYFDVFVDVNPVLLKYLNQGEEGYLDKKIKVKSNSREAIFTTYPDFNIHTFLKYALLELDISELLSDQKDKNHKTFERLEEIYNEIKLEHRND